MKRPIDTRIKVVFFFFLPCALAVFSDPVKGASLLKRVPASGLSAYAAAVRSEDCSIKNLQPWLNAIYYAPCLKKALEQGVSLKQIEPDTGLYPMAYLLSTDSEETDDSVARLEILLNAGESMDEKSSIGRGTPLCCAAGYNKKRAASLLIGLGADVESSCDVYGNRPLMEAISRFHPQIAELILDTNRVNVNATHDYGRTPLDEALHIPGGKQDRLDKMDKKIVNSRETIAHDREKKRAAFIIELDGEVLEEQIQERAEDMKELESSQRVIKRLREMGALTGAELEARTAREPSSKKAGSPLKGNAAAAPLKSKPSSVQSPTGGTTRPSAQ